jgi:hypothetical protein
VWGWGRGPEPVACLGVSAGGSGPARGREPTLVAVVGRLGRQPARGHEPASMAVVQRGVDAQARRPQWAVASGWGQSGVESG